MPGCVIICLLLVGGVGGCVVRSADDDGGGSGSGTEGTAGSASATSSTSGSSGTESTGGCAGTPIDCYPAMNASDCGDASIPGDCVDGTWTCPSNSLPESECDWPSSDSDSDGNCVGPEPVCLELTENGCSDLSMGATCIQLAWQCPGGYIPIDNCPDESGTGSTGGGSTGGSTGGA